MKAHSNVGIVGYSGYIPSYRIKAEEIASLWGKDEAGTPKGEMAVAGIDEDCVTMAVEATRLALKKAKIDPNEIGAIYMGSESKPYAVKSCGAIIAEAVGASRLITAADYEFACKAGTEALQSCIGLVASGMIKYGVAIGVDAAQGEPSDDLEYNVACGGAAFILGPKTPQTLAYFEASASYVTDTPDFWRRAMRPYPSHAGRFTGEPGYFKHVTAAAMALMEEAQLKPSDFTYAIFHQPNAKFPLKVASMLGFSRKQLQPGFLAQRVGNVYAGSSLLSLAAVLDIAKPGDRIFLASYGSGSGSDAFSIKVQNTPSVGNPAPSVGHLLNRKRYLNYAQYARFRGKLVM